MYSGKMCYKSITYSGANMRTTLNECDTKCMLRKCRSRSNGVTAS